MTPQQSAVASAFVEIVPLISEVSYESGLGWFLLLCIALLVAFLGWGLVKRFILKG